MSGIQKQRADQSVIIPAPEVLDHVAPVGAALLGSTDISLTTGTKVLAARLPVRGPCTVNKLSGNGTSL